MFVMERKYALSTLMGRSVERNLSPLKAVNLDQGLIRRDGIDGME